MYNTCSQPNILAPNRKHSPGTVQALLLKLLCQESCAQDEGVVLLPLRLQSTCDLQYVLTVKS